MAKRNILSGLGFLLCLVCIGIAFGYSTQVRKPFLGKLALGHHQWLTGSTLTFSRNWYREGALALKFGLYEYPSSVEMKTLQDRSPYPSYPAGAVLPIYLLAELGGREPSVHLIHEYNRANQFLIAILLGGFIYSLFRLAKLPLTVGWAGGTLAGVWYLLNPASMYWHQNVFFSDQAVILPFALMVVLEVTRTLRPSRLLSAAQALMISWGILTDWFFVFGVVFLCLYRVVDLVREGKPIGESQCWRACQNVLIPALVCMAIFLGKLIWIGILPALQEKFLIRTGLSPAGAKDAADFTHHFWSEYFPEQFGKAGALLFVGTLSVALLGFLLVHWRTLKARIAYGPDTLAVLKALLLFSLPCLCQVYCFRNHTLIHDFSLLKFAVPLAVGPFLLIPLFIYLVLRDENVKAPWLKLATAFTVLFLGNGYYYLITVHAMWPSLFPPNSLPGNEVAALLRERTGPQDIVFSPTMVIERYPPQLLAISGKRVYAARTVRDIQQFLEAHQLVPGSYRINLLLFDKDPALVVTQKAVVFEGKSGKDPSGNFRLIQLSDPDLQGVTETEAAGNLARITTK